MRNRVPTRPGRVLITPEDGSAPYYATLTRADEPTQIGDPLGKATFLKDDTAALYGLTSEAVPDDALAILSKAILINGNEYTDVNGAAVPQVKIETGSYVGTGTYGEDNPCSLAFNFEPKLVLIFGTDGKYFGMFIKNTDSGAISYNGDSSKTLHILEWTNTLRWYERGYAECQLNISERTYRYAAIG